MKKHALIFACCLPLMFLLIAHLSMTPRTARAGGSWYVANGGNDADDCLSPTTPCESINAAIGKASPGDIIYVGAGTYTSPYSNVVYLDKSVILSGGWNPSYTVQVSFSTIDGQGSRRGIYVDWLVTAVIERFEILNGAADWGGGVSVQGSTLDLLESNVHDNSASFNGGGIYNGAGSLTIQGGHIENNTADGGGGIYNDGSLSLIGTTISNNSAGGGGGIRNAGVLTVTASTINSNVGSGGGAIFIDNPSGALAIVNSTISGNQGGGVYVYGVDSDVRIQNSTIAHNST